MGHEVFLGREGHATAVVQCLSANLGNGGARSCQHDDQQQPQRGEEDLWRSHVNLLMHVLGRNKYLRAEPYFVRFGALVALVLMAR